MTDQNITTIREFASKLVGGPITDYQITFCAVQANVLEAWVVHLEDLPIPDLERLFLYLKAERLEQLASEPPICIHRTYRTA